MCKFIEEGLYPYIFKTHPHIFEEEVVEPVVKKTKLVNDILINDRTKEDNTSI